MAAKEPDTFKIGLDRARQVVGFLTELGTGGALIGVGIHDALLPTHLLLAAFHLNPLSAGLAGITFLGVGRPLIRVLAKHVGDQQ